MRIPLARNKLPWPFVIKSDVTPAEHSQESILLKQRWLLILSGIPKHVHYQDLIQQSLHQQMSTWSEFQEFPLVSDYILPSANQLDTSLSPPVTHLSPSTTSGVAHTTPQQCNVSNKSSTGSTISNWLNNYFCVGLWNSQSLVNKQLASLPLFALSPSMLLLSLKPG